jgi:hypothetical protein
VVDQIDEMAVLLIHLVEAGDKALVPVKGLHFVSVQPPPELTGES